MKWKWKWFAALLVVCAFAFLGYGCTTEAAKETRTVKFLNGGEVFYEETVEWGNEFSFPENDPLPADPEDGYLYTFEGWTASENYNEYRDELVTETFPVYKDEVLYSVFSREKKGDGPVEAEYLVEFVFPNDSEIFGEHAGELLDKQTVSRGDSAEEPDHSTFPEITGYHFVEWDRTFDNVRGRLRVTAVYAKNHYRLIRHYLGEEITEDVEYKGDLTWDPVEGVADAFVFDGWYLDEGFGEEADLAEMPAGDLDVYAKYHIDIGPATVLSEGTMAYGDESNSLYVSGMRQAAGLVYTFTWTVNGRQQSVKDRIFPLRNAGNYEVSVHLNASFKDGLLTAEADAKNESSEVFHFSVSKAALTVSASLRENSIVYGSGSPQVDLTYTGFVLNDTAQSLSIRPEYTYYRGSDPVTGNLTVGSYTVATHIPTLQNYSVTDPEALPFSVTKRPLHVYLAGASLTYGDAFAPVLSYDEFAYEDSASDLGAHTFKLDGAAVSEGDLFDAGTHAVTVEGFASTEYEIILPEAATFTVAKRAITARTTAEGCTYGGEPTLGYVPENVLERDLAYFAESVTYTFLKEGAPYEKTGLLPAGSYTATAVLKDNQNYEIAPSAPASFTVGKQALTVGVSIDRADASYVYGTSPVVTITYEGFVDGDNQSAVTGTPRFTYFDEEGAAYERISFVVGSYTVSVANTLSAANYELSYTSTSFEITKAPLTLTVSIEDSELVYGERPAASIGYAGFVNNETSATVFGHTMPAISYSRDDGKPVEGFHAGAYTATTSATAQNYEITVESASFTIEKAPLTVTVTVASLTYGEEVAPVVTFNGFKNNESETALGGTRTFNYKKDGAEYEAREFFEAGSYTVVAGGYSSDDYTISYSEGSFEVAKAALTVKVTEAEDFADFTYGNRFVELSHTLEGLVANDEEADLGTLTYTVNGQSYTEESLKSERLHAAEYSLAATGLTSSNYDITYVYGGKEASTAEFTVSARQVTLTVESGWSIYAEDKKPYNWYTLSGESILDKELTFAVALRKNGEAYETNEPYFSVGKYETVITFEENSDYALTVSGGTRERGTITHSFTVSPRPFSLSLNGSHKWADRANWSFTPAFGDDGLGFKFVGTVVFANAESAAADEYTAQNVEQFGKTFQWKEGSYKILHGDTDVTANFSLVYRISLILDTSDFNITLPDASETSFVYDAQDHFLPVKATAEGVTAEKITCLYRIGDDHGVFGETYTIRNAGKYTVYVQISAPNCETAKRHFDINVEKANFEVQAPDQSYTYNKGDQGVEITVHAIGDDGFTILYNEKENGDQYTETVAQFSNAATHTVNYRVTGNENYNDAEGHYNIVIDQAQVTAPTIPHATYNKAEQKANVSDTDDYDVTTNEGGTDAGSYDVVLTLKDSANYRWSNGNSEPLTLQFVIDKAVIAMDDVTWDYTEPFTYKKGTMYEVKLQNLPTEVTAEYSENQQEIAGTYHAEATFTYDERNYEPVENKTLEWTIDPAQLTRPTAVVKDYTFNGTEQTLELTDFDEDTMSAMNRTQTDAGKYQVTVSLRDSHNYQWATEGADPTFTFEIQKLALEIKTPEQSSITYDTQAHEFAVEVLNMVEGHEEDFTVTYRYKFNGGNDEEGNTFKAAGNYAVQAIITPTAEAGFKNYLLESNSVGFTVTINAARLKKPVASGTYVYDGSDQKFIIDDFDETTMTVDNDTGRGANTYTVTVSLQDTNNYVWDDGTTDSVKLTFVIEKCKLEQPTANDGLIYNKGAQDLLHGFASETMTAQGNLQETDAGEYHITVGLADPDNYEWADGSGNDLSFTVKIAKATVEKPTADERSFTYNQSEQTYELSGFDEDTMTLSGDGLTQTGAGDYRFTVSLSDMGNYEWTDHTQDAVSFTFHIAKATLSKLPEGVERPTVDAQINWYGKTLGDIDLGKEKWSWAEPDAELQVGEHSYSIVYNPDPANYNDFAETVTFNTEKTKLELKFTSDVKKNGIEVDYDAWEVKTAEGFAGSYTLVGTNRSNADIKELTAEMDYLYHLWKGGPFSLNTPFADGKIYGGTYLLLYRFSLEDDNPYYEWVEGQDPTELDNALMLKIKSVDYAGTLYTIEDALHEAQGGTITVKYNTAFAYPEVREEFGVYGDASYYTVKSGVTLLVPYAESVVGFVYSGDRTLANTTTYSQNYNGNAAGPAAKNPDRNGGFATLVVSSGTNLTVYGNLTVNAVIVCASNPTTYINGSYYGEVIVEDGAEIHFKDKSVFDSMGYTRGDGHIFLENGAKAYELFNITGYKGGTISSALESKMFPINQYTLSNIVCRTTFESGAALDVRAFVAANMIIFGISYEEASVSFLSESESSFLQLISGSLTKWIDETSGEVHFELDHADFNFHNISLAGVADTKGLQIPIPGNFTIDIKSGKAIIGNGVQLKLLPGAKVIVGEKAVLTIESSGAAYSYGTHNVTFADGHTQFEDGLMTKYPHDRNANVYRIAPKFDFDAKTPAELIVNGRLSVASGAILAAEITSEKSGILSVADSATVSGSIYENDSSSNNQGTHQNTLKAVATHQDGTGVDLQAGTNYSYEAGKWVSKTDPSKELTYTVKYHDNFDGADEMTETVSVGYYDRGEFEVTELTRIPVRDFYRFTGWYLDAACEKPFETWTATAENATLEVYAGWEMIDYIINYHIDGAGTDPENMPEATTWNAETDSIALSKPTSNNESEDPLTFSDWFFDGDYSNNASSIDEEAVRAHGYRNRFGEYVIDVYGYFSDPNKAYDIVYDLNLPAGYEIDEIPNGEAKKIGDTLGTLPEEGLHTYDTEMSKSAYFVGWSLNGTIVTGDHEIQGTDIVDEKITLVAQWKNKIKISKNCTNGEATDLQTTAGVKISWDIPCLMPGTEVKVTISFTQSSNKSYIIEDSGGNQLAKGSSATTVTFKVQNNDVKITVSSEESSGCFAPGTMVMLADGTEKKVEDLVMGVDYILAFDHMTGQWTSTNAFFIMHRENQLCDTVKLYFSDGTMVHVYFAHGFFDIESNQYEMISPANVADYVGHTFYKYSNGGKSVQLIAYETEQVYSECYSIYTGVFVDHVINGMLAVSDGLEGLYNVFELDENMKYDEAKMQADIEKYGLFTYEEWADYCTEEEFYLCNVQYLKVALGKGLVTMDQIYHYFNDFLAMFH